MASITSILSLSLSLLQFGFQISDARLSLRGKLIEPLVLFLSVFDELSDLLFACLSLRGELIESFIFFLSVFKKLSELLFACLSLRGELVESFVLCLSVIDERLDLLTHLQEIFLHRVQGGAQRGNQNVLLTEIFPEPLSYCFVKGDRRNFQACRKAQAEHLFQDEIQNGITIQSVVSEKFQYLHPSVQPLQARDCGGEPKRYYLRVVSFLACY